MGIVGVVKSLFPLILAFATIAFGPLVGGLGLVTIGGITRIVGQVKYRNNNESLAQTELVFMGTAFVLFGAISVAAGLVLLCH